MNIRFTSSLTPDDENAIAPAAKIGCNCRRNAGAHSNGASTPAATAAKRFRVRRARQKVSSPPTSPPASTSEMAVGRNSTLETSAAAKR